MLGLSITTVLLALTLQAHGTDVHVVVIAHSTVPLDTLSRSELIDYYTGERTEWPDETAVVLLDLKPKNATKKAFYDFLGKRPSRLKSIWMKKMLSGEGDPPEALQSETEILEKVASTPGALSFVRKPLSVDQVKTLLVIPESE